MGITKHQDKVLLDLWQKIVLLKAGYKCELCGSSRRKLDVHHIFSRRFKSTRWDLENGIVLCATPHHKYGQHSAHETPEWFRNWLIDKRGEKWYMALYYKSRMIAKPNYGMMKMLLEKELEMAENVDLSRS